MIRGTMPTFTITINGIELSEMHAIHVTFKSDSTILDLTESDNMEINENTISIWLTQEQSLSLKETAQTSLQVNGLTVDNKRWASNIATIVVKRQLLDEVIE